MIGNFADRTAAPAASIGVVCNAKRANLAGVCDFVVGITTGEEVAVADLHFIAAAVFGTDPEVPIVAELTERGADLVIVARALFVDLARRKQFKAVDVLAQDDVADAGNRVRPINRRRTVEQQVIARDE